MHWPSAGIHLVYKLVTIALTYKAGFTNITLVLNALCRLVMSLDLLVLLHSVNHKLWVYKKFL